MSKLRLVYRCTDCGSAHPKWSGRCTSCEAWNTLVEDVEGPEPDLAALIGSATGSLAVPISEVATFGEGPTSTGIGELDRVLGGGLVPGSITLLSGEPGIGKSTLLLQLASMWPGRTLYVSAEESAQQVRLRAERLDALGPHVWLLSETSLTNIVHAMDTVKPELVIVDSIQSVADVSVGSAPGSVVQVRGCAQRFVAEGKARSVPVVLVGHVTKDGTLAGPRLLEHVVDTVLSFEGDRHHALRLLRAAKHRFGSTSDLGVFEMVEHGLVGVPDASSLLLGDRRPGLPGSVVTATLEGQRPLLVEVQALTNPVRGEVPPRRSAQGLEPGRLAMLLAVLEARAGVPFGQYEVYTSVVGGVRLTEPGADLPTCLAMVSARCGQPLPADTVVFGEVGLGGELRQVAHASRRLAEAARLGFDNAIVPASSPNGVDGIRLIRVRTVREALLAAGLGGSPGP
jgi:DNA repair protein RadA/Sms